MTQAGKTSDEFYSTKEFVEKCMSQIKPDVFTNKIVYMPADTEESEFVKYFKAHIPYKELIYTSDDMFTHKDIVEYADIIYTNPPFSKKTQMYELMKGTDFILMNTLLSVSNRFKLTIENSPYVSAEFDWKDWKNITKSVQIVQYSNIDCFILDNIIPHKKPKFVEMYKGYPMYKGGNDYSDLKGETLWMPAAQYIRRQGQGVKLIDFKDNSSGFKRDGTYAKTLVKIL